MSKRKSKAITIGKSENKCKQCFGDLYIKKHPKITSKQLNKYFYFSQWEYCPRCKKVFFDERYKVMNRKGFALEERQQQLNHFNSI